MINESQFNNILNINNVKKNTHYFFGSPLKKFINNIYTKYDFPQESFTISLFYLNKFYNLNKSNHNLMNFFFNNITLFVFSSIIITLKHIYDQQINIKYLCYQNFLNYKELLNIELIILKNINWQTFFTTEDISNFKKVINYYYKYPDDPNY